MVACTYIGFFDFKLSGFYGLFPNKQTHASNLLFSASWTIRLVPPMVYNFILMLKLPFKTAFEKIVLPLKIIPFFGEKFQVYFPLLIFVICILCYFDTFLCFMSCLNVEHYTFELNNQANLKAGMRLVSDEYNRRANNEIMNSLVSSHNTGELNKLRSKHSPYIHK
jgi:hypothetical protein